MYQDWIKVYDEAIKKSKESAIDYTKIKVEEFLKHCSHEDLVECLINLLNNDLLLKNLENKFTYDIDSITNKLKNNQYNYILTARLKAFRTKSKEILNIINKGDK